MSSIARISDSIEKTAARLATPAVHWIALLGSLRCLPTGRAQQGSRLPQRHCGDEPFRSRACGTVRDRCYRPGARRLSSDPIRLLPMARCACAGGLHTDGHIHRQPLLGDGTSGTLHGGEFVLRAPGTGRWLFARCMARPEGPRGETPPITPRACSL